MVWGALLCIFALYPVPLWGRHHDTPQKLEARIARERNPVKKAKFEIRLGNLLLDQAEQAYDSRHIPQGQRLLANYTSEMQDAWKLLKSTGRNAAKKPDGFMQLEIALRENNRDLHALRRRVFYLYRGPIDEALKTLGQLHNTVLVDLFPGAVPPPNLPPDSAAALHGASGAANAAAAKRARP